MIQLNNKNLFSQKGYLNGEWIETNKTLPVLNPATNAVIGTVPNMGTEETKKAIESANAAFPDWRARTAKERATLIRRWHDLILENKEDLAMIMTCEQGKTLAEAAGEVLYSASFLEWFVEEGKRTYGDIIPTHKAGARIIVTREPVGVVAAITPWNFPLAMIARKLAPALVVGCTMVFKPDVQTPFSALALASLGEQAGIPAGVFNVVTGDAVPIGKELTTNPIVRKITFTGSTAVGKKLLQQSAGTVKNVSMELGGNAPFIVFDDADLEAAVAGALISKYRNAGQTCICTNRFYIQSGIYDAFVEKMSAGVAKITVGNGLEEGITQGPLINEAAVKKVESHIQDATQHGARVVLGGKRHHLGGTFFEPTLLADVTQKMLICREEIFGPVAAISRFETEEEAIAMANDTEFGLASYFYTRDIGRAWRVGEALEYGMVGINEGLISTVEAPFGGFKESGIGREGSKYGIEDYTEIKYMLMGGI